MGAQLSFWGLTSLITVSGLVGIGIGIGWVDVIARILVLPEMTLLIGLNG